MFSRTKLAAAAVSALIATTGLAACASGPGNGSSGGHQKVIGLLAPETTDNSYSAAYVKAAQQEAEKQGVTLKIYNAKYSASTQASQADELLAQKPEGIVLWPADSTAISPIITKAKALKIPLSISNSEVSPDTLQQVEYYTGPSNTKEGEAAAELMNKALGGKGEVAIVEGLAGNSTAIDRADGFINKLAKIAPDIKIVAKQPADWDKTKAISVTSAILNKYGSTLAGIYSPDDTMASGASQALQAAGKKPGEIKLVGIGFSKVGAAEIKGGYQYGTVFQSPLLDGKYAIQYMAQTINGNPPSENQIFIPIPEVTAGNISKYTPEY
jgi:ribose transport system substrate-binding protein